MLIEHIPYEKETSVKTNVVGVILDDYSVSDVARDKALLYMASNMRGVDDMFQGGSFRINPVVIALSETDYHKKAAARQIQDYMKGAGGAVILVYTSMADMNDIPELARMLNSAVGTGLLALGESDGPVRLGITPGIAVYKEKETKLAAELKHYRINISSDHGLVTLREGPRGAAAGKKKESAVDQYVIVRSVAKMDDKSGKDVDKMVALFGEYLGSGNGAIKKTISVDDWNPNDKSLYNGTRGLVFVIHHEEWYQQQVAHDKIKEMSDENKSVEIHSLVISDIDNTVNMQPHGLFNVASGVTTIGSVALLDKDSSKDVNLNTFTRRTGPVYTIALIKDERDRNLDAPEAHFRYQLGLENTVSKLDDYLESSDTRIKVNPRIKVNEYETIDELKMKMDDPHYELESMLVISINNRVTNLKTDRSLVLTGEITDPGKESSIIRQWAFHSATVGVGSGASRPALVMMADFSERAGSIEVREDSRRVDVQFNKIVDVSRLVPSKDELMKAVINIRADLKLKESELLAVMSAPADLEAAAADAGVRSGGAGSSGELKSIDECGDVFTAKVRSLITQVNWENEHRELIAIINELAADFTDKGRVVCDAVKSGKESGPFTKDHIEKIAVKYFERRLAEARQQFKLLEDTKMQKAYIWHLNELIKAEKDKAIKTIMFRSLLKQKLDPSSMPATEEDAKAKAREVFRTMRGTAERQVNDSLRVAVSTMRNRVRKGTARKA